jgi:hypothetical protein
MKAAAVRVLSDLDAKVSLKNPAKEHRMHFAAVQFVDQPQNVTS